MQIWLWDKNIITLYLVAGLDPASSGYQASVLWGIDQYRAELYLIDLENRRGGGVRAALDQMADWLHKYDCRHWIVEENGFQSAIRQDAGIKEFTLRSGITIQGHLTGKNKHDPLYGVGASFNFRTEISKLTFSCWT